MLSNAYFLAKFRFDTAENEPAKFFKQFGICKKICWEKNCKNCLFGEVVVSYDVKEFMALATKKLEVAKRMIAATTPAEKAAPPLN